MVNPVWGYLEPTHSLLPPPSSTFIFSGDTTITIMITMIDISIKLGGSPNKAWWAAQHPCLTYIGGNIGDKVTTRLFEVCCLGKEMICIFPVRSSDWLVQWSMSIEKELRPELQQTYAAVALGPLWSWWRGGGWRMVEWHLEGLELWSAGTRGCALPGQLVVGRQQALLHPFKRALVQTFTITFPLSRSCTCI